MQCSTVWKPKPKFSQLQDHEGFIFKLNVNRISVDQEKKLKLSLKLCFLNSIRNDEKGKI